MKTRRKVFFPSEVFFSSRRQTWFLPQPPPPPAALCQMKGTAAAVAAAKPPSLPKRVSRQVLQFPFSTLLLSYFPRKNGAKISAHFPPFSLPRLSVDSWSSKKGKKSFIFPHYLNNTLEPLFHCEICANFRSFLGK